MVNNVWFEPTGESHLQTMTAVGKALVIESTALVTSLLGFSATKLGNTTVWQAKETWKTTGKIPSYADLDVAMKQAHPIGRVHRGLYP